MGKTSRAQIDASLKWQKNNEEKFKEYQALYSKNKFKTLNVFKEDYYKIKEISEEKEISLSVAFSELLKEVEK